MNTVLTFLQRNWQRLDLERYGAPSKLSCVVITPRFRASSHVVFLVLPQGKSEPVLVAKMPRLAGVSNSIEREVTNLRAIQASRAGGFDSIPRVIAFEQYNNRSILVETALIGQPIDPATVRRDFPACGWAVTNWLTDIQRPARDFGETDPTWFERLIEQPLHYFEEALPLSTEETRLLEQTRTLVAPLRQANLPLIFEHNDLSHPNVMRLKDGQLGVVDWEQAEPRGLPASDLFFFLTYAAFARHNARTNGDYLPAFQSAFFGRAAWARSYVGVYVERLALPPSTLTPLFVLSWLRYMTSLLMRLGDTKRSSQRFGPETAAWLRSNRYYDLWRHTVTHANELDWDDLPRVKARNI